MQNTRTLRAAAVLPAREAAPIRVSQPAGVSLFSCARQGRGAGLILGVLLVLSQLLAVAAFVHSYRAGPPPAAVRDHAHAAP